MKLSKTYPGILAPKYWWQDANGEFHEMEGMPVRYLKNVKKRLDDMKSNTNAEDYQQLGKKIGELDKAISVVTAKCKEKKLSDRMTDAATARAFDIYDLEQE